MCGYCTSYQWYMDGFCYKDAVWIASYSYIIAVVASYTFCGYSYTLSYVVKMHIQIATWKCYISKQWHENELKPANQY